MQIVVDIPEIACVRCGSTDLLNPQSLRLIPRRTSAGEAVVATDNRGGLWAVTVSRPGGWTPLPADPTTSLCPLCSAAARDAMDAFIHCRPAPPPPESRGSTIPVLAVMPQAPRQSIPMAAAATAPAPIPSSSLAVSASVGAVRAAPQSARTVPIPQHAQPGSAVSRAVAAPTAPAAIPIPQFAQQKS